MNFAKEERKIIKEGKWKTFSFTLVQSEYTHTQTLLKAFLSVVYY